MLSPIKYPSVNFRNYYERCWLATDGMSSAIYDIFPNSIGGPLTVTATMDGVTMTLGEADSYDEAVRMCESYDAQ